MKSIIRVRIEVRTESLQYFSGLTISDAQLKRSGTHSNSNNGNHMTIYPRTTLAHVDSKAHIQHTHSYQQYEIRFTAPWTRTYHAHTLYLVKQLWGESNIDYYIKCKDKSCWMQRIQRNWHVKLNTYTINVDQHGRKANHEIGESYYSCDNIEKLKCSWVNPHHRILRKSAYATSWWLRRCM